MTIAKGRTNCKAERDIVLQGFREQLQILEDAQNSQESQFKARLYDTITDATLSIEEKEACKSTWLQQMHELDERHIRIRRAIFIGLYSFWEISLLDIIKAHIHIPERDNQEQKKKKVGADDYLNLLYGNTIPQIITVINANIREFRNYLVHGSLYEDRKNKIESLVKSNSEFCICSSTQSYYISSYKGIEFLSNLLEKELDNIENQIINSHTK